MSSSPPIEMLPENTREDANALRAYLKLEDLAVEIVDPKHEREKQNRLEQAIDFANDHHESRESRLLVARTTLEHLKQEISAFNATPETEFDEGRIAGNQEEVQMIVEELESEVDDIKDGRRSTSFSKIMTKVMSQFLGTRLGGIISGIGASLLAYLGLDEIREWFNKAKGVKDMVEEGKEKVDKIVDDAKKKVDEVKKKIDAAEQKLRIILGENPAKEEVEKLKKEIEEMKNEMKKKEEQIEEEKERVENESKLTEGVEFVSEKFVQAVIPTQFDIAEVVGIDTPEVVMMGVGEIFTLAKNNEKTIHMSDFLVCMDSIDAERKIVTQESFDDLLRKLYGTDEVNTWTEKELEQKRIDLHFLVIFLAKHRVALADNAKFSGRQLESMSLGEAISAYARINQNLGALGKELRSAAFDAVVNFKMPNIDFDELFNTDLYTQAALRRVFFEYSGYEEYNDLSKDELETFNKNAELVAHFLATSNVLLKRIPTNSSEVTTAILEEWKNGDRIKPEYQSAYDLLIHFANDIRRGDSKEEILRLLMVEKDPEKRSGDEKEIVKVFDRLFDDGELRLSDALQMRILSQSGAAGNVMTMFKALAMLKAYTPSNSNLNNDRAVKIIGEIARSGDYPDIIDRLQLSPEAQTEIQNIGEYICVELWEKIYSMYQTYIELWEHEPAVAATLTAVTGAQAAAVSAPVVLSMAYIKGMLDWNRIGNMIDQGPEELMRKFKSTGMTERRAKAIIDKLEFLNTQYDRLYKNRFIKFFKRREIRLEALQTMRGARATSVTGLKEMGVINNVTPPPVQRAIPKPPPPPKPKVSPAPKSTSSTSTPPPRPSTSTPQTRPKPPPPRQTSSARPPRWRGGPEASGATDVINAIDGTSALKIPLDDAVLDVGPQLRIFDPAAEALEDTSRLIGHLDDGTPVRLSELLDAAQGNEDAIRAIMHFDEAGDYAKIMAVVDDAGDTTKAVAKLGLIGKAAKVLNVAGGVFDSFSFAYAAYQMHETGKLIERTPESSARLRELYAGRYKFQVAEMGVSGVGLGALAIGGTAATPIVLATIPISVAIGAGYQWHEYHEIAERSAEDWQREFRTEDLVVDLRTHTYGEMVGQGMEARYGASSWWEMLRSLGDPLATQKYMASGKAVEQANKVAADLAKANEARALAIVKNTAMVSVPTVMRVQNPDGTFRDVSMEDASMSEARTFYDECIQVYHSAAAAYIIENGKGNVFTGIADHIDIATLLTNAYSFAKLQHDKFVQKKTGEKESVEFPDATLSSQEQAMRYAKILEHHALNDILGRERAALAMGQESGEVRDRLKNEFMRMLSDDLKHMMVYFTLKLQEGNLFILWSDGDAAELVSMDILSGLPDVIDEQTERLATLSLEKIQMQDGHIDLSDDVWREVRQSRYALRSHLGLDDSYQKLWERVSGDSKHLSRLRYALARKKELSGWQGQKAMLLKQRLPETHVDYHTRAQEDIRHALRIAEQNEAAVAKWLQGYFSS